MKRLATGAWRLISFLVGSVLGVTPMWLADKQAEEERRSRLV
jgi:hypothetical protein